MPNFLINTDIKLKNIVKDLSSSSYIGVDTEFIRESTYYPKLALLQLSDENNTYCIDILQIQDMEILKTLWVNNSIKKIFHSAKQDLEVINHYFNCHPNNVFDTQIAYNLLSIDVNISYSNLVKKYFDITLKDGSWRTDWLKRPLSKEKIEYAANDVKYLLGLYQFLKQELVDAHRYSWLEEEINADLAKDNIVTIPSTSWKKINLPSNTSTFHLKNIKTLSKWREEKAIINNIPKSWIFNDRELIKIATAKKNKLDYVLSSLKHEISSKDISYIKDICKNDIENKKLSSREFNASIYNNIINKCHEVLQNTCEKHQIASTLIANKRDIDLFARGKKDVKFLCGWRFKIFGKLVQ